MEMSNRNKKVNKKSFSVFMIFALLLSLFAGCTGRGNSSHKTLRVAVVQYTSGDNFIDALTNCMKEQFQEMESEDLNIIMTVRSGDNNQSTQDKVVEEMIDAGCDILCVDLVDRTSPSKIIRLAEDAGIPVIFFNRELVREDLMRGENLFYVGGDAAQSGVMQGELAAVTLASNPHADRNRDGKIQYVVLEGQTGHQDTIIRTDQSVETLRAKGYEMEKVTYQTANWNRAQAENKVSQIISEYGTKVELILANNDEMALGAIDAYEKANITASSRPLIFGIDGLDDGIEAVKNGSMQGTVYNDKEGQASAMTSLAYALFMGQDLSQFDFQDGRYLILPYREVTTENTDDFEE